MHQMCTICVQKLLVKPHSRWLTFGVVIIQAQVVSTITVYEKYGPSQLMLDKNKLNTDDKR